MLPWQQNIRRRRLKVKLRWPFALREEAWLKLHESSHPTTVSSRLNTASFSPSVCFSTFYFKMMKKMMYVSRPTLMRSTDYMPWHNEHSIIGTAYDAMINGENLPDRVCVSKYVRRVNLSVNGATDWRYVFCRPLRVTLCGRTVRRILLSPRYRNTLARLAIRPIRESHPRFIYSPSLSPLGKDYSSPSRNHVLDTYLNPLGHYC